VVKLSSEAVGNAVVCLNKVLEATESSRFFRQFGNPGRSVYVAVAGYFY
jgi:hypothetical protein